MHCPLSGTYPGPQGRRGRKRQAPPRVQVQTDALTARTPGRSVHVGRAQGTGICLDLLTCFPGPPEAPRGHYRD